MIKKAKWLEGNNRKTISLSCGYCEGIFHKSLSEYKRNEKLGKLHFCSLSCVRWYHHKLKNGNAYEFSYYSRSAGKRAKRKNLSFNLTPEYLKELFNLQSGRCAISNMEMILNKKRFKLKDKSPYYASLDRIDNNLGYIKGNVQFVCLIVNYMKNTFNDKEVADFLSKYCNENYS